MGCKMKTRDKELSVGDVTTILDEAQIRLDMGQIEKGINDLVARLYNIRISTPDDQFKQLVSKVCLSHPICRYIHQDPYARRSFNKPRGYAGDAVLIDYFYGFNGPDNHDTTLGRAIFDVSMARSSSESVRYRRDLVARIIDQVAEIKPSAHILSVACGHLREASLSVAVQKKQIGCLIAFDQDKESIAVVAQEAVGGGLPVETITGSIRNILTKKLKINGAAFVYAAGLYDYLEMSLATRLTARMFEMLGSGGRLLVANFAPETEERGYMEAFMDWQLFYRDEAEVAAFAGEVPPDQIAQQQLYRDPEGNVIYLELIRR